MLVTGCDTGIGHELAKHLDSMGFQVRKIERGKSNKTQVDNTRKSKLAFT